MLIWKLQTVRWGHGQEWDNLGILNYSHTILTALPSERLFGVRPKWLIWLGYEVWWCIIPKKLAKELHFPSGNGWTKDSDWLVSFSLTKLPIRSGLFRPKVPGVRGSNDRPWGRTCWHPRGKSNGTGGGVGTPTLQLMDRYDLDADFSCRVVGVGRGWGLRLVSTCCFVILLFSINLEHFLANFIWPWFQTIVLGEDWQACMETTRKVKPREACNSNEISLKYQVLLSDQNRRQIQPVADL